MNDKKEQKEQKPNHSHQQAWRGPGYYNVNLFKGYKRGSFPGQPYTNSKQYKEERVFIKNEYEFCKLLGDQ